MKLELRDIACGYDQNNIILKNITFTLESGNICTLLGPNGVGKTTLFKTILQLIPSLKGNIYIDGDDISKWSVKKRSRYLAYVAQVHVPTYPYTVKDMAMFGRMGQIAAFSQPSKKDYEIVEQALEDVGISHLRNEVYTEISGGERQLLMIARALAQEAKILIMDEPTANLDYGNMIMVMNCISQLAKKGLCIIFTTHMPDQALMCMDKTALIYKDAPMIFGDTYQVVTKKNLESAYHADVEILEVIDSQGNPVRVCVPGFSLR